MSRPDPEVEGFLEGITHRTRRRDAETMIELMGRITGEKPKMWGSIVGFGRYHYRYESGREGDAPAVAFSPRKAATTIYLPDGVGAHRDVLDRLGPHTTGVGCLYVKDLDTVDLETMEQIVGRSFATLVDETYTRRAREGEPPSDL